MVQRQSQLAGQKMARQATIVYIYTDSLTLFCLYICVDLVKVGLPKICLLQVILHHQVSRSIKLLPTQACS